MIQIFTDGPGDAGGGYATLKNVGTTPFVVVEFIQFHFRGLYIFVNEMGVKKVGLVEVERYTKVDLVIGDATYRVECNNNDQVTVRRVAGAARGLYGAMDFIYF